MRTLALIALAATLTVSPRLAAGEMTPDKLKPVDVEVLVRGSLADVWNAWTTNDGVRQWFAPGSNIDLRIGGPYEIYFMPDAPAGQRGGDDLKVLAYLPQEMLTFEWSAPPKFAKVRPHRSWVVVRFTDVGDGTVRVRLTNAGFAEGAAAHPEDKEEWVQVREYFSQAWPFVLENCRKHFAKTGGEDTARQVTEGIVEAPLDAVWNALTTKEGWESWNVAHCEFDLRVGGKIRSHYDPAGVIGDPNTIENVILAYEPQRMYAIRVGKPPEKFPFKEAVKNVWHVIAVEDAGAGRTRVRVTGLGYGTDGESQKLRKFFEAGNAHTLKKLQKYLANPGR
jgi:uncharacterized protein YndB with AHSA1/START domain